MTRRLAATAARYPAATALATLTLSFVVTLVAFPWSDESVGDLSVRSAYAEAMLDGDLPYRDYAFEYPPLAAPAVALAGLGGVDEPAYRLGIAALSLLLMGAVVVLVGTLGRRGGGGALAAMLTVAAAPLLLGAVIRLHFDPLAVALTASALVALLARRPGIGLALVGLGALTKGFPIVIAPVALAWLWGQGDRRGTARGVAGLATTLALVGAGWLALSPAGALDTLAYQLDRPVQIESAQASVLFLFDALGGPPPEVFSSHGSAALDHPVGAPVEVLFASGLGGLVALLSWGAARAARHVGGAGRPNGAGYSDPGAARALVLAALGAVAVFVAFGRVLSPQYLIWVIPLLALAVAWGLRILSALLVASCALTLAEFPSRYVDLVELDSVAVTITMARNVALLGAAAAVTVAVWRSAGAAVAGSPAEPLTAGAGGAARSIVPSRPAPRR